MVRYIWSEVNNYDWIAGKRDWEHGIWVLEKYWGAVLLEDSGWGGEWEHRCDEDHDCGDRQGEEIPDKSFLGTATSIQLGYGSGTGIGRLLG